MGLKDNERKELKIVTIYNYIEEVCWKGRQIKGSEADSESYFKRVGYRIIANEVEKKR